jgi:membrane protease YdiL (CAAX protease family)
MTEFHPKPKVHLLWVGLLVEGGLFLLGLLIGWFGFYDKNQPLHTIDWEFLQTAGIWGVAALLPMLIYLAVFQLWTPPFIKPMKEFVDSKLKPMFESCSIFELLLLSIMAGFGEEIFFRWCLQGGITSTLEPNFGTTYAIVVGILVASWLFGLCHWVNATYGISTMLVGLYLGWTMIFTNNWLVPAITHTLFDFVALIVIVHFSKPTHQDDE